jgi:hypothetical protein
MNPRCKPGDLAVVVDACYRTNLGRIVRVVAPHDGKGDLVFSRAGIVWLVQSPQPMTWTVGRKRYRRKRGPVPDACLKPIRGNPVVRRRACSGQAKKDTSAGKAVELAPIGPRNVTEFTGMDDPRWMAKIQKRIDDSLTECWSGKEKQPSPDNPE